MGFKTAQEERSPRAEGPYYAFGETPFTIRTATDCKTVKNTDMLKIVFDVTDTNGRSGKFTSVIFGNEEEKYQAFLACVGKPELFGKEVDGSTFDGCQGVLLMGWDSAKGFNIVDAYLPFDRNRKTYNRYKEEASRPKVVDDWGDSAPVAAAAEVEFDDIPF